MNQTRSLIEYVFDVHAKALATVLFLIGAGFTVSAWAQSCPTSLPIATTLTFSGAPSVFTVPNNVTLIRIIATGASGGTATTGGFSPGAGARAEGSYSVSSGQTVTALVGAKGQAGEFEAGGGGASGAYLGTTLAVIAGGGGGQDNTGNGGGGQATTAGGNGGTAAGADCPNGGLGGTAGAGGQFGELGVTDQTCQTGDGGAGGGGLNAAGGSSAVLAATSPTRYGPTGGGQCSIAGAAGGLAGIGSVPASTATGVAGGYGVCGGGGADARESGGGGGYSGGGGGPEGALPGGGGSFVSAAASTPTLVAGANGGGTGANGQVVICYALPTLSANLAITKTDNTSTVAAGSTTSYSILVTNNGPGSADGAALRDPMTTGLSCTAVSCSLPTGGASCPASGSTTIANLQSLTGILLPSFPSNSSLTFNVTCGVTATGT
jgi:uncharacterized repeat protein (TIGR01451 family)